MAIAILNLLNETGPSSYRLYIIRCSSLWLLLLVVSIACVCVLCGFLFCTFSATQFSIWPKFVSSTAHNTQHTHVVPANSYIVKYISFSNALPNNKQKRVVLKAVQGKNEFSNAMNSQAVQHTPTHTHIHSYVFLKNFGSYSSFIFEFVLLIYLAKSLHGDEGTTILLIVQ